MKITLDLPEELLLEAIEVTQSKTISSVIVLALKELVRITTISKLKNYKGKIDLGADLEELRNRNQQ